MNTHRVFKITIDLLVKSQRCSLTFLFLIKFDSSQSLYPPTIL